jgi:hypothetical protein
MSKDTGPCQSSAIIQQRMLGRLFKLTGRWRLIVSTARDLCLQQICLLCSEYWIMFDIKLAVGMNEGATVVELRIMVIT